ncbi:hypothetical protein NE237_001244 [Protea cynaroides]|uniref:Uncharacterized protein n=1 Tax=Protea cynaroides TaxID=273540 RepID=A0A9Q0QXY1_9MAGN|nr:hypothetical protein NE237_001244 [Protea cynaroides]
MPTPFPGFSPSSIDDGAVLLNSQRLPLWDPPSVRRRNGGTIFGFKEESPKLAPMPPGVRHGLRLGSSRSSPFAHKPDQKRKVESSKPAAGICSRCGGGARVADMKTSTRFCFVPVYWRYWKAIICTFCGAILKSYR